MNKELSNCCEARIIRGECIKCWKNHLRKPMQTSAKLGKPMQNDSQYTINGKQVTKEEFQKRVDERTLVGCEWSIEGLNNNELEYTGGPIKFDMQNEELPMQCKCNCHRTGRELGNCNHCECMPEDKTEQDWEYEWARKFGGNLTDEENGEMETFIRQVEERAEERGLEAMYEKWMGVIGEMFGEETLKEVRKAIKKITN